MELSRSYPFLLGIPTLCKWPDLRRDAFVNMFFLMRLKPSVFEDLDSDLNP